jgi:glycosyltransferase involved in cell wall biosynthesis
MKGIPTGKKIKLLHLITNLSIGGSEIMLWRLLERMDETRFANAVVCMIEAGPVADRIREMGIPVFFLGMKRKWPDPRGLTSILRLLRNERPDILQTWLYHSDLLGLLAGKIKGVPRLLWNIRCSNMDMNRYGRLTAMVVALNARLSGIPDSIIVNSYAGKEYHQRIGYRPKRWEVIPNGFDPEAFKPSEKARTGLRYELGLPEKSFLIGLVARFDPMKDHRNYFLAARQLLSTEEGKGEVHFVLAGFGVDVGNVTMKRVISECGLNGRVHLLGERTDIPFVTSGLDIASSSSLGEGFPNVVGEAMACGVPCVVTDVGDSAWLVGDTGRVVPPGDPIALAGAWRDLIRMGEDRRRSVGEAARRRIVEGFSIDVMVRRYETVYEELTVA